VFGAVLAIFTHRSDGDRGAVAVLDGFLIGLLTPAVFFVALAFALPAVGLAAFALLVGFDWWRRQFDGVRRPWRRRQPLRAEGAANL
jgi:hypothetical protein